MLSALLRAGALPAPLTVIEERSVGPDLGSDAIEMGLYTGLAGFALVVLFMLALYRTWGLIANLALSLNVALTLGALSLLGATLTLPGDRKSVVSGKVVAVRVDLCGRRIITKKTDSHTIITL